MASKPPVIVRHRPQAQVVYPQDFCTECGGAGILFCIDADDPELMCTLDCTSRDCTANEHKGIPLPTPNDVATEPLIITHDGIRGIARKRGGVVKTGNLISGTIEPWTNRRKMP